PVGGRRNARNYCDEVQVPNSDTLDRRGRERERKREGGDEAGGADGLAVRGVGGQPSLRRDAGLLGPSSLVLLVASSQFHVHDG
ncbi:hypothetical protein DKP78_22570, partial [Enterococcus faecium]